MRPRDTRAHPASLIDEPKDADGTARSEAAWRLRHLPQTALRDVAPATGRRTSATEALRETSSTARALSRARRYAAQVNFLTTGSLSAASGWLPSELPRGVAGRGRRRAGRIGRRLVRQRRDDRRGRPLVLGAARRVPGAPRARACVHRLACRTARNWTRAASPMASWRLAPTSRAASAGMYAIDRWQARPDLELNYGARIDRYDYVAGSALVSPRARARLAIRAGNPRDRLRRAVCHRARR